MIMESQASIKYFLLIFSCLIKLSFLKFKNKLSGALGLALVVTSIHIAIKDIGFISCVVHLQSSNLGNYGAGVPPHFLN